ncbi:MAG TPA: hypothetical protein VE990_12870 [Acidimicrobiales bacterium]|nr:hypothetical protein [Acidimicrobiales bacterium]
MLRRIALAATVIGGTVVGGVFTLPPAAHADSPGACVTYTVNVNGTGASNSVCTPAAPALP